MARQEQKLRPITKSEAKKDLQRRAGLLGLSLGRSYTKEDEERVKNIFSRGVTVSEIIVDMRRKRRGED